MRKVKHTHLNITRYSTLLLIGGWLLLAPFKGRAQNVDLEKVGKKDGVKVSGGVAMNNILYFSDGIDQRRETYNFFINGNMTFNFYDLVVPLSFSYSDQQFSYRQPFNQLGISPKYKWVKGHFGYRNMSFSPYTLAGHIFLGGGLELTPSDKWDIKVMYGRLNQAVELNEEGTLPFYRRRGTGINVGYKTGGDEIRIIMFTAWDQVNSLETPPDSLGITPQRNMVWSIKGKKQLFEKLNISAEFARSGLTLDRRSEEVEDNSPGLSSIYALPIRTSTAFYNAIKGELSYDFNIFNLGVGYERVDPGYATLGAYFFNNDLENITLNFSTSLFKDKMSLSANIGRQRDNLAGDKMATTKRTVGSVNGNVQFSKKLNVAFSYSNFSSFVNIRPVDEQVTQLTPFDNFDTLQFTQISQNASLNGTYMLKSSKKKQTALSASTNFQRTSDKQGTENFQPGTNIFNGNLMFTHSWTRSHANIHAGLNGNLTDAQIFQDQLLGFTLGVGKALFERKLRTNLSANANNSYRDGVLQSRIYSIKLSAGATIKKSHSITTNVSYLNRNRVQGAQDGALTTNFNEWTITGGYAYAF